jgi:hypothetical protein
VYINRDDRTGGGETKENVLNARVKFNDDLRMLRHPAE